MIAMCGEVGGQVSYYSHLLLLLLSSASLFNLRFLGGGLSPNEHSAPFVWQATQFSSSSLMMHSSLRRRHDSQGVVDICPLKESVSGVLMPLRKPEKESL